MHSAVTIVRKWNKGLDLTEGRNIPWCTGVYFRFVYLNTVLSSLSVIKICCALYENYDHVEIKRVDFVIFRIYDVLLTYTYQSSTKIDKCTSYISTTQISYISETNFNKTIIVCPPKLFQVNLRGKMRIKSCNKYYLK